MALRNWLSVVRDTLVLFVVMSLVGFGFLFIARLLIKVIAE